MWNQQPVRNLLTNPSGEVTTSIGAVRTNFAPCPRMTSAYLGTYNGVGTLATVTGISGGPDGVTTALRVTYTAAANSPGVVIMPMPDVNTQYTVTAWVYNEGATSETIAIALKGFSSGGSQTVPQGVWTKLTWTLTTPGTLVTGNDFGVRIPSSAAAGSFLTTGVLIEKSPVSGSFFDGAFAAAGDYTYQWSATPNASNSQQRAVGPVGWSSLNAAPVSSVDWAANGTRSVRALANSTTNTGDTAVTVSPGTLPVGTYTLLATCRLSAVQTGTLDARARRILAYHSGSFVQSAQAPNAIGTTQLRVTFKVTDAAAYQNFRLYNGAPVGNGDVWWDNVMLVEGEYTGDYVDGTKPFSKWDGTAHASTSVGYPQWLYQLAGVPTLEQIGPGSTSNVTVDGFIGRTIYHVYDVVDASSSWQVPLYYGSGAPNDGFTLQTAASPSLSMSPRFDFNAGGGDINRGFNLSNARSVARTHVMAMSVNQGLTVANFTNDGTAAGPLTLAPGTVGWTSGQIRSYATGTIKAVHTLVYYTEHDVATRQAVSRYLGNKYGANVA